jgi:hypothetical protein
MQSSLQARAPQAVEFIGMTCRPLPVLVRGLDHVMQVVALDFGGFGTANILGLALRYDGSVAAIIDSSDGFLVREIAP